MGKIITSRFKPAWWLPGPHLQTLGARNLRGKIRTRWERLELPDGDFVDLAWTLRSHGPLICVFHGLAGSLHSPYIGGMLAALDRQGMRAVLMHFRGCSGQPNRLARAYHSGDTADINYLISTLHQRGENYIAAIGFSLGGNALLKYLGECGEQCLLQAAVAISPPFVLSAGVERMRHGFSRIYQRYLLNGLKRGVRAKTDLLSSQINLRQVFQATNFQQFDEAITAPLHGFRDALHYYTESSCRQWLTHIRIPTLIIHSRDDPFYTSAVLPTEEELAPSVTLELSQRGGHMGFIQSNGHSWLNERVPSWLELVGGKS